MPVELLSFSPPTASGTGHRCASPGRPDLELLPLLAGGARRRTQGRTEPVVLAAGLAEALRLCDQRLLANGVDPISRARRDRIGCGLLALPGLRPERLPAAQAAHNISSWWQMTRGRPAGRSLVSSPLAAGIGAVSSWHGLSAGAKPGAARCWRPWDTAPSRRRVACGQPWPWLATRPGGLFRRGLDGHSRLMAQISAGRVKSRDPQRASFRPSQR